MNQKIKSIIKLSGTALLFGCFLTYFFMAFMGAYFHESKEITIAINHFHEANSEFFLVWASLIFGAMALIFTAKDEKKVILNSK